PKCGAEVSKDAAFCSACGAEMPKPAPVEAEVVTDDAPVEKSPTEEAPAQEAPAEEAP
ncbi:MAG TPA: 30S ribosomal protein S16, partial [Clostridiales bacterium]|nr:30S ribosomal protein S16 [Clostridiales bacterium]